MPDDKENKRHVREIVNSEIEISNRYVHRVVGLEINSDQVTVETKRKKRLSFWQANRHSQLREFNVCLQV